MAEPGQEGGGAGETFLNDVYYRFTHGQNIVQAIFGALRTLLHSMDGSTLGGPF